MLETIPKSALADKSITYKYVDEELINGDKKAVVLDFSASWCGPCQKVYPLLEALAVGFPEVKFFKVDVSKDADGISEVYEVESLPTIISFYNGTLVSRDEGVNEGAKNILDSFAKLLVTCERYSSVEEAEKGILEVLSNDSTDKANESHSALS